MNCDIDIMDELPELLISHFEDPYHRGQCERATHGAQSHDPDSQHSVMMQLRVRDDGTIEEAWYDSQGCIYCEAPASILAMFCESKAIDELMDFDVPAYLALTQLDQVAAPTSCHTLAWSAFQRALRISADFEDGDFEGDLGRGDLERGHPLFGGPSLGEES